MRFVFAVFFAGLLLGCPRAVPPSDQAAVTADAGVTPQQLLARRVDAIDAEVEQVVHAVDEALWTQWTTGAALDVAKATAGHDALFSKASLDALRTARAQQVEVERARHLEAWLSSELLARGVATETEAIASLEAGATFTLDGREVAWRELPRLLVNERSAVKRRALWAASLSVVERLDALLAAREEKAKAVLAPLEVSSVLDLMAQTREVNLEVLAADARHVLEQTDVVWSDTLKRLSAAELKLPVDALTRADLPRLLKVPAAVDAVFPKASVAKLAVDTVGELGLAGTSGLTLELTEGSKKKPLPLTVVPARGDVRVSYRPTGGLRDMTQLLGEVGTALALHAAHTGHVSTDRLGDPSAAQELAELVSSLVLEPEWLTARGISPEHHAAVIAAAKANRLYAVRRACLGVLLHLETAGLPEADARAHAVELMGRALGVKVTAAEGVRLRLELDDGLRSATQLQALLLASQRHATLGAAWWKQAKPVLAEWSAGTATPIAEDASRVAALARLLEGAPAQPAAQAFPGPVEVLDGGRPFSTVDGGTN